MIKIKNVSRKFVSGSSSTDALIDINLEIKTGEFIALMGPSGSGKSTLLNLIGGLDFPDEGKVLFKNQNIAEFSDKEASKYRNEHIGFVFQEFYLESFLNLKQNVLLPTYFNGGKKQKESYAEKLIKDVKLSHKTSAKISELSGGQKQRVAIARALINKPKILLADEPTGNLDLKTGKTILDLLVELHKNYKTTLIIATHDEKVAKSAKRIIRIIDGKITEK